MSAPTRSQHHRQQHPRRRHSHLLTLTGAISLTRPVRQDEQAPGMARSRCAMSIAAFVLSSQALPWVSR